MIVVLIKEDTSISQPNFYSLLKHPVYLLALGFGSGLAPKAPGTVGTLAAIPFFLLMFFFPTWCYAVVIIICLLLGIYFCQTTEKMLGVEDHPAIVWDEFVGLWITLVPLLFTAFEWHWLAIGFIFFRIFDILKPWPISLVDQHTHGGLGIMLDDILAGIVAAICLWILILISN